MIKCPVVGNSTVEEPLGPAGGEGSSAGDRLRVKRGMCPDVPVVDSTEEEHKRLMEERDQELEEERREKEESARDELMRLMEGNRLLANEKVWKTVKWITAILASTWIVSQVLSFISTVNNSTGIARYVALTCVVAIAAVCIWCVVLFYKVCKSVPRVEHSIKTNDGKIFNGKELKTYVQKLGKKYPVEGSYAKIASIDAERYLRDLLTKDFGCVSDGWIDCFEKLQGEQKKRAMECVSGYAKMVGVGTATCPWKAGDVFIVFSSSISLVVEIARIFNRIDVNRFVAFKLIRGWLSQMYIAGHLQDVTELAVSKVSRAVGNHLSDASDTWVNILGTFAEPLKKVLGKVSEGAVNGLLCYRFGKMAIREFSQLRYESEVRK